MEVQALEDDGGIEAPKSAALCLQMLTCAYDLSVVTLLYFGVIVARNEQPLKNLVTGSRTHNPKFLKQTALQLDLHP